MRNLNCSHCLSTLWYLGVSAWATFVLPDLFYWWLLVLLTLFCGILWDVSKQKSCTNVYKCRMVTLLMCWFCHNSMPVGESQRLIFNRWQNPKSYNNGCSYFHYCHLMTHAIVGKDLNWIITGNILRRTRCTQTPKMVTDVQAECHCCPYSRYIYCWGLEAILFAVIHKANIFPSVLTRNKT